MNWLGILLILTLACAPKKTPQTVVLTVGQLAVSLEEFSYRLALAARDYSAVHIADRQVVATLKQKVVEQLISENLLLGWAQQEKFLVNDKLIDKRFKELAKDYPTVAAFQETFAALNLHKDDIRRQITIDLIKEKLLSQFTPAEALDRKKISADYWQDSKSYIAPAAIKVQQIVVKDASEADAIYRALAEGKSSFARLAEQYSLGAEATNQGVIGWIEKGTLPIFDETFTLPVGQISQPKESPFGYHIFRVLDRRKSQKLPLAEVIEQISRQQQARQQEKFYQKWLEEQLQKHPVKYNEQVIAAINLESKGS